MTVLAEVVRSGRVEARHEGSVAAVGADGAVLASWGDVERAYFFRSSAKPFQALVCQEAGAGLLPEYLAVACASHSGQPVHAAIVRAMLAEVGLGEEALRCPPAWPYAEAARDRLHAEGHRRPQRIWHNCSGKHAAMLRACLDQGWPTDSYTGPDHPLQQRIAALLADLTGQQVGPPGVDECGVPVFPVTTLGLARAYARLAVEERLRPVAVAMHRFPALTADAGRLAARLATWLNAAAKGGAEANMGVAIFGRMGVAAKCWDGSFRGLGVGMLEALRQLGVLVGSADQHLTEAARPSLFGGGRPVGNVEPALPPLEAQT